jgi:drug/metabolite transporter (DMT)-like permease
VLALAVGVLAVSTGALFVRFAQAEATSLTIAAYRLGIALLVVLIPTSIRHRHELQSLTPRDLALAVASGLFLALHFAAWISSLALTSVAVSVVLVNTAGLWVGMLTMLLTRERLARGTMLGIALSVLGAAAIGYGLDRTVKSTDHLMGGCLAVLGAVAMAVYLMIGRDLQRRHAVAVYVTVCYGAAAGFLWLAALATRQPMSGFSWKVWGAILGLALVSQVIGHTANNWALRFVSPAMVAVALVGEPIGSTLLAYFLLQEAVTPLQVAGGVLILIGIALAARGERTV